jgi:hypothetical protein
MNPTTAQIIAWLTSRIANWLTPVLSALFATAIGVVVAKLAIAAPWLALPPIDAVAIGGALAVFIVTVLVGTLNGLTNKYLTAGTKQVQETVNKLIPQNIRPLELDGVAGPRTLAKLATVVKPADTKP